MKLSGFISAVIFTAISVNGYAIDYYVSQEGNNLNDGRSWRSAWATLEHAAKFLYPGDTLIIRKGENPYNYLPIARSGTQPQPIIIKGENPADPPIITGATEQFSWNKSKSNIWTANTTAEPNVVLEDGNPLVKGTNTSLKRGSWFWKKNVFYYSPTNGTAYDHTVLRNSMGGGVQIADKSWIQLEDLSCIMGKGSCVSIKGNNNTINNVSSKWYTRGIEINGGKYNKVNNCYVEFNKEGVYLLGGASNNEINGCKAYSNGNLPIWNIGDRAGIAIGETGVSPNNRIINNEVAFNGGPNSDPAVIAYNAPGTLIENNHIHDNYGSGIFITINSDNSIARNNLVEKNGADAVKNKNKNISGLSVRRSKSIKVEKNKIKNNYVAKDSNYLAESGPRAGLDLRGVATDKMTNIDFNENAVCGTKNGPNVYIHNVPDTTGFHISDPVEYLNQITTCDD